MVIIVWTYVGSSWSGVMLLPLLLVLGDVSDPAGLVVAGEALLPGSLVSALRCVCCVGDSSTCPP